MPPIELTLPDMSCDHCVRVVTQAVRQVDASATVSIDLPAHRVRIDSTLPAPLFTAALAEEGYPAAA
jgi:copper chaperone